MEFKQAAYISPGKPGDRGFEDLECYKLALDVIVNAYELARKLPTEEKFDLAPQLRRASKSVTANIAEGYGRYHYLDSLKFYSNARGSLNEMMSHVINARVLEYIDQAYFEQFYVLIQREEKMLNGYMTFVRKQQAGYESYETKSVREGFAEYKTDNALPSPNNGEPSQ